MADIQEVFQRIKQTKQEKKKLSDVYRDALAASGQYKHTVDQIAELQQKKKQIEASILVDFTSEMSKLDGLKLNIKGDQQLLSDMVLNKFMKGETVTLTDEYEQKYEPSFQVRFKKAS